jgi:hypothetical protein
MQLNGIRMKLRKVSEKGGEKFLFNIFDVFMVHFPHFRLRRNNL